MTDSQRSTPKLVLATLPRDEVWEEATRQGVPDRATLNPGAAYFDRAGDLIVELEVWTEEDFVDA